MKSMKPEGTVQSSDRKIRHLAVLEKQKVIGIASIGVGCDVDHIRSGGGN